MSGERAIAVKVALLIVVSLGLLGVFVLSMGEISLEPKFLLRVGFRDPGGLKVGAPVEVASVKVGSVTGIEYVGGTTAPAATTDEPVVRVEIRLLARYQAKIHDDAVFYLTTRGLLAEQIMVIEPGSAERPPLPDGAVVRGRDPPRLDQIIAEAVEFMTSASSALREERPELRSTMLRAAKALRRMGAIVERHEGRTDAVGDELERFSVDLVEAVRGVRRDYVDHPEIDRTVAKLERSTAAWERDLPPELRELRTTVRDLRDTMRQAAADDGPGRTRAALERVTTTTAEARKLVAEVQGELQPVRQGRGSLGAVLLDDELYDDLCEAVVHLRKNPWKFFWRE